MTGLELIKAPAATAEELAEIISERCPPVVPPTCDGLSCRVCWAAWMTGEETEKRPEAPEKPEPRTERTGCAELDAAEKTLQELFRRACSDETPAEEKARLIEPLSTLGRLLEKERHAAIKDETEILAKIAAGLYDGSIIAQAESGEDGKISVKLIDTIRRRYIGSAIVKQMGSSYFVESMEITSPQC